MQFCAVKSPGMLLVHICSNAIICPCLLLQSASVSRQLESTQAQLSAVSAELHSMQQLLQQQRYEHAQALVAATAAKQATVDKHQMLQQKEVSALQLSEQRLNAELAETRQELSELLSELEQERESNGRLHSQIMKLQNEFADTRAAVDAERKRAAALGEERSRLEAALEKATAAAAAAEAEAAAAKKQAEASAKQAQQAAAEAEGAKVQLSEAKDQAKELGTQLHIAVEVVAQQQEVLQQRTEQLAAVQQEVVDTRKWHYGRLLLLLHNPIAQSNTLRDMRTIEGKETCGGSKHRHRLGPIERLPILVTYTPTFHAHAV